MKTGFGRFSDGMSDAMIAETWLERTKFWLMALIRPSTYRLGSVNGEFCIWKKRPVNNT